MLAAYCGICADVVARRAGSEEATKAEALMELLTPICKGFMTDTGFESANWGMQVFGGHGYIRDHGMEQLVRDARICQIYEGTNGVQAMDLVGRKLTVHTGRYLRSFFLPVAAFIEARAERGELAEFIEPLAKAFVRLQKATSWIAANALRDPKEAGAAASDYLRLFALVALAYLWARSAEIALEGGTGDFYRAKLNTARFFMQRVLPQSGALFACIVAGGASIEAFEDEDF